ncbi:MAG: hypothetical protein WAT71_16755 [Ignavibacteria bacterium]
MKKQILKFNKTMLLLLLAGFLISCGDSAKKEQKTTEDKPKVEEKAPVVENKVKNDGDGAISARVDSMHKTRFIELFFAYEGTKEEGILAECFNTMFTSKGIPVDKNTAPQDLVKGLNLEEMAKENGVLNVSLNGPKLWLPDWTDIDEGVERSFNGIEARWVARLSMGDNKEGVKSTKPYTTQTISRKSSLGWNKGTKVLLLDDADGNTWIMKGFQLGLDPIYTYEEFFENADSHYKNLPEGWKVRVITLEKDLIETPKDGLALLIADDFFNVFDKTGQGMMNYQP